MDYWEVQKQSQCGFVEEVTRRNTHPNTTELWQARVPPLYSSTQNTVLEMAVMGQLGINGKAKIVKGKKKNKPCQGKNLQWPD